MNSAYETLFAIGVDTTVKASVLLLAALIAVLTMRKASAAARHAVLLLAAAGTIVVPIVSIALPGWNVLPGWINLRDNRDKSAVSVVETSAIKSPVGQSAPDVRDHAHSDSRETPATAFPDNGSVHEPTFSAKSSPTIARPTPTNTPIDWRKWTLIAWLTGAVTALIPPIFGTLSLRRLRRTCELVQSGEIFDLIARHADRPITVLMTDRRTMPMTWGILRSKLLLPREATEWSSDRLRVVVLHELAHVKRRDCLWQWIMQLGCAMYWFHPLIWLTARRAQCERERACDDRVIAAGAKATDYAEHLLQIASGLQSNPFAAYAAIAMARPSNLESRLLAIIDPACNRRRLTRAGLIGLLILGVTSVLPLAMLHAGDSADAGKSKLAVASQPATEPAEAKSEKIEMHLMDVNEKPVVGADVYLFTQVFAKDSGHSVKVVRFGPVKSDENGLAVIENVSEPAKDQWTSTFVYARVPGKLVGGGSVGVRGETVQISLVPSTSMKGKVSVPSGFDAKKVNLSIRSLFIIKEMAHQALVEINKDIWPEVFRLPVAADGGFVMNDVPISGSLYLSATLDGLGEAQFMTTPENLRTAAALEMRPEGVIEGIVVDQATSKPVVGVDVNATPGKLGGVLMTYPHAGKTDSDGKFVIRGLPESIYTISVYPHRNAGTIVANREGVRLESGGTVSGITMELEKGAVVTGSVVDAVTGRGIAHVNVTALNPPEGDSQIANAQTDENGIYAMRLPTGDSRLYISSVVEPYRYPPQEPASIVSIARGVTTKSGPKISLKHAEIKPIHSTARIIGRVIDSKGVAVKGLHITDDFDQDAGFDAMGAMSDRRAATTDERGRFSMKVYANVSHQLGINDVDWKPDGIKPVTPKTDQTIDVGDIVIHPHPVIGEITGFVVDPKGNPITGAWLDPFIHSGPKTGADGKFRLPLRDLDQPVQVWISHDIFAWREWDDVPPGTKNAKFILFPNNGGSSRPLGGHDKLPRPDALVGKSAPDFEVEQWVFGKAESPKDPSGKKTLLLFKSSCREPEETAAEIAKLERLCKIDDARGIVIFSPLCHESGVRFALGAHPPDVAIGIDQYVPIDGNPPSLDARHSATRMRYGLGSMPILFVIDETGTVIKAQESWTGDAMKVNPKPATH